MGLKFPSLAKNGSFWPNLAVFWPKIHYDHYIYPQFWTVFNVIWWKRPGHQKWPRMTWDTVRAGIMEKRPFLCPAKKCFLGKKCVFSPKTPKFAKRLIFILEKGTFFFEQLFPVEARTWLEVRSEHFFWNRNLSAQGLRARARAGQFGLEVSRVRRFVTAFILPVECMEVKFE